MILIRNHLNEVVVTPTHNLCLSKNKLHITFFLSENCHFYSRLNRSILHRHVNIMGLPKTCTVMILSFWTDWSGQIMQTQEQSDQGVHYLQYCLHLLDALLYGKIFFFLVL